jgi:hypothetical protein
VRPSEKSEARAPHAGVVSGKGKVPRHILWLCFVFMYAGNRVPGLGESSIHRIVT